LSGPAGRNGSKKKTVRGSRVIPTPHAFTRTGWATDAQLEPACDMCE
jgi:hypothetical protein